MTGVFILLMAASLFLSPRDISIEYALLNRAFFAFILVISSIFIEEYVSNVEGLALSEERYRYLTECSPDGIIVYRREESNMLILPGCGSLEPIAGKTRWATISSK